MAVTLGLLTIAFKKKKNNNDFHEPQIKESLKDRSWPSIKQKKTMLMSNSERVLNIITRYSIIK